jgi:putative Mn2+ efflux pump MntP
MKELIIISLIAFTLAIDAFAVSLSAGAYFGKATLRQKFRLSFHFGLFQFFMPLIGWFAGAEIVRLISQFDHWLAFGILTIVGTKMIIDSIKGNSKNITKDISRGISLFSLAVATSIDALAVGITLGIINAKILIPAIIIGIVAASMSLLGIKLGEKLSSGFGFKIAIFGGIVLILIGIQIVLEHLKIL